jgi:hypothetical protein
MRRAAAWIGAFLVAALAGGGAVVALNATVLGPGEFVRIYLDALARGDAQAALALPGVEAGDAGAQLLRDDVLSGLTEYHQVEDESLGEHRHRITFTWAAPGGSGETAFEVERVGTRLGLFPEWGFAVSPIEVVELDVLHDPRFTANGVPSSTGRTTEGAAAFALLVPGSYEFGHESTFLTADPVTVLADEPGGAVPAELEVRPGAAFAPALAEAVHEHLRECTAQHVLFPTACPFGQVITNRIVTEPQWTIPHDPVLEPQAGGFGVWRAGPAPGTAHLVVDVQSLFDGSIDTFDQDVPFQAEYDIRIVGEELRLSVVG